MLTERLKDLNLLGIDVGYADTKATTGIARSGPAGFVSCRTTRHWRDRGAVIGSGILFDCVAIDGPLLPSGMHETTRREVERAFISGPFGRRCKPGLSDFGQGLAFRRAAQETLQQVADNLELGQPLELSQAPITALPVVEAFPNGFLGVLLPDSVYGSAPKFGRGKKFDWLYEQFVGRHLHEKLMTSLEWKDECLLKEISGETDHEKRAALICLLTAGCAASGRGCEVGDADGGWFCLPPLSLWEPWARTARVKALISRDTYLAGELTTPPAA